MNREEIIALAIECGDDWYSTLPADQEFLIRFAGLIATAEREACKDLWEAQRLTDRQISDYIEAAVAAEREECAKVCDERELANLYGVKECAAAIRARGNR